jgi:endothelin-converting enzyme
MDIETQALAQEKADAIYKEVAYPDCVPSNDELDKYFEGVTPPYADRNVINVASMTAWRIQWGLNKLNEPTTRDSWISQPATVNAWYLPEKNSITFPAGILQAPFFDKDYPK